MRKLVLVWAVVLFAGLVTVKAANLEGQDTNEPAISSFDIDQKLATYRCFRQALDEALEGLSKGKLSLKAASNQVAVASHEYYPPYLHSVRRGFASSTETGCVAQNLLTHLKSLEDLVPDLPGRVVELQVELEELVRPPAGH